MYEVQLREIEPIRKEGPSGGLVYEGMQRGFHERTLNLEGQLVLTVLSSVDPSGITVFFDKSEIPKSFRSEGSLIEDLAVFREDELAIDAITGVLDKHFGRPHVKLQDRLEQK